MPRWPHLLLIASCLSACGSEGEMLLSNRLDTAIGLEVRAPRQTLTGGCDEAFRARFCAEEYEIIGVLDFAAGESRRITVQDQVDDEHCTNLLWLRLVWLGAPDESPVGPARDPGTLVALPVDVEVEDGAGVLHEVAFAGRTVRIDEVGGLDARQDLPPSTCAELDRQPRP